MARVQIFSDDLLFGSRLQAELTGAGHEVSLALVVDASVAALIADLTVDAEARIETLAALGGGRPPTLAFYSHVEPEVRDRARAQAAVDLVVPRSRLAREAGALLDELLATAR
jgi:hypothetical protein